MADQKHSAHLFAALPFWISIILLPILWWSAWHGGWAFLIVFWATWTLFALFDVLGGLNLENMDPNTDDDELKWYRAVTLIWMPLQFVTIFGLIYWVTQHDYALWEQICIFVVTGVVTGTIGINYSHELMHQKNRWERMAADLLLAMVMYSHFRSEHTQVHHIYVGTPRDPVTARYGESFYKFFPRVLIGSYASAFHAEQAKLARVQRPWFDIKNPFFLYWGLQIFMLALAYGLGGAMGIILFFIQSFIAILHLEIVNYVEHYGLTRKHLGDGRYEHVRPHHSWNAAHRFSNWLLINLQRHSDHHYKPNRRFPLLQNYTASEAPQLPYGYTIMAITALFPRFWKSRMNPRVRKWRDMYYPEITDWKPYNRATNPMPR